MSEIPLTIESRTWLKLSSLYFANNKYFENKFPVSYFENKYSHFPISFPDFQFLSKFGWKWLLLKRLSSKEPLRAPANRDRCSGSTLSDPLQCFAPLPFPFLVPPSAKCSLLARVLWREKCWSRPRPDMFGAERGRRCCNPKIRSRHSSPPGRLPLNR